mgnify:CR=1 FL=1
MKAAPEFEVTFLGTGTSHGVPMIGCECAVCTSEDPRDNRLRTSILIRTPAVRIVVDTSPDFRTQCLRERINEIDAVLYTHSHTDHIMGFDDLRRFCELNGGNIPIYATPRVMADLRRVFQFAFDGSTQGGNYIRPVPHEVTGAFQIGDLDIVPVQLPHGRFDTTGYIFSQNGRKRLAYMTDCSAVPAEAEEAARGAEWFIVDGLRHRPHPTHMTVAGAMEAGRRIEARKIFLTHICHDLPHEETERTLPEDVRLAFDGLRIAA